MEAPEDNTRNHYIPMEALNSDILSQLRRFMMSKESCGEDFDDPPDGYSNMLGDESDWMMAEKNKPRSPPVSPAVPWSRSFDFKSPEKDIPIVIKHRTDLLANSPKDPQLSPRQFIPDRLIGRSSEKTSSRGDGSFNHTPQFYREREFLREKERALKTRRQLFCEKQENSESDRISQLLSFIESTSSSNIPSSSSPALRSVQTSNTNQQQSVSNLHSACNCTSPQSSITSFLDTNHSPSKRRKLDNISIPEKKENIPKQTATCTCSMMEEHFLQMAETAYKNIRRKDTSPASFEQFKRELTQTNEILKDSFDLVNTIKEMCEHKKTVPKL